MASIRFVVGCVGIVLSLISLDVVLAYPDGAPTSSCVNMKPDHGENSLSQSPFDIILSQEEMNSDDILTLTLQANVSTTQLFEGFLIMGFDTATDVVIGKFKIEKTQTLTKTLTCYSNLDSAATHKSSSQKKNVTLQWIPPEGFNGTVVFKTTFAESKNIYWLKVLSKEIKIDRVEPVTTTDLQSSATSTETEKPSVSSTAATPEVPDIYIGCESRGPKGCAGSPNGCINSRSCLTLITYRKFDDILLEMEIYGKIEVDQYVAVGFSADREMEFDSVVECVNYQGKLGAYQSFNPEGKNNYRLDPQLPNFSLNHSAYSDGYIYCKVFHPIIYTIEQVNFNLSTPYYLLMVAGPSGDNNIRHHTSEESSSSTVILTEDFGSADFEEPSRVLKQLHGSFMIIAWLMAGSIGILFPNYMKKTWVGKQIFGKDRWFIYHQGLMMVSWTLTMIGFILILIDVGGWVSEPFSINPHPVVGCITTVLAFIQPFMAAFRPPPGSPTRYVFNWAHSVVGNTAHILALTTIFLAVEMEEAELPYETYWILTAHASCYLLSHLFLNFWKKKMAHMPAGDVKDGSDIPRNEKGPAGRIAVLCTFSIIAIGLGTVVIVYTAGGAS